MAKILLIGLGGTGSRVVNNVRALLRENGNEVDEREICFAVLDTNVNDNQLISENNSGVSVFPTSRQCNIETYLQQYPEMKEWCPDSAALRRESMLDGASEVRMKSRIAFMDYMKSGRIDELKQKINTVLGVNSDSKIRVMIVSSLSGGTGSGMFIQVALWIRKILSFCEFTIRGIFLLPDIFVTSVRDIRENTFTRTKHYCNAYAAIREMNAISKIMKNGSVDLREKITLDGLFDSDRDSKAGRPLFDYSFLIDDKNVRGTLTHISEYEKTVAQMVYMQMFAPMHSNIYSEEDNAFVRFQDSNEPLYGSCGTAKAVYPLENVKQYCIFRAVQNSVASGWRRLDEEIEAKARENEAKRKSGMSVPPFDRRAKFIDLYENKTAIDQNNVGRDRFFLDIANDSKNSKISEDGKEIFSKKEQDFLNEVDKTITETVKVVCDLRVSELNKEEFVRERHSEDELRDLISGNFDALLSGLENFYKNVESYAERIVDKVFPYSMGDVRVDNVRSVYGMLSKRSIDGTYSFIHPLAARYVLYKLAKLLEKNLRSLGGTDRKDPKEFIDGFATKERFDNRATSETESTPEQALESRVWYQLRGRFLDNFEGHYADYLHELLNGVYEHESKSLRKEVYIRLLERVEELVKKFESFFRALDEVPSRLQKEIEENVSKIESGKENNVLYVLANQQNKEEMYESLDFRMEKSASLVNQSVVDSLYGSLCSEKRPFFEQNKPYSDVGLVAAFLKNMIKIYRDMLEKDQDNREKLELDIYQALCKQSDYDFKRAGGQERTTIGLDDLNLSTGAITVDNTARRRHREALRNCVEALNRMSSPYLMYGFDGNQLPKVFWGFHPTLLRSCDVLGDVLGVNVDLQMNRAYSKNELYCYRAIYGIECSKLPKVNEYADESDMSNYYNNYRKVVDGVLNRYAERGEEAYVALPHLDKRWHTILPYVTGDRQDEQSNQFYRGFWLAIAYGALKVKDNRYCVTRDVSVGGKRVPRDFALNSLTHSRGELISELQGEAGFSGVISAMDAKFNYELARVTNYVGTQVVKGLTQSGDLNPIDFVTRYDASPNRDENVRDSLILALECIADELASNYLMSRTEESKNEAKYRICKMFFDAGTMKSKSEVFSNWVRIFKISTADAAFVDGETPAN